MAETPEKERDLIAATRNLRCPSYQDTSESFLPGTSSISSGENRGDNIAIYTGDLPIYQELFAKISSVAANATECSEKQIKCTEEVLAKIWEVLFLERDDFFIQGLQQTYFLIQNYYNTLQRLSEKQREHVSSNSAAPHGCRLGVKWMDVEQMKNGPGADPPGVQLAPGILKDMLVDPSLEGLEVVSGLSEAKQILREALFLPRSHPHLFKGSVKGWTRMLMYGPPGTGKTLLARAIAAELKIPFYYVSCSDILSSWVGETEKRVRELFQCTRGAGQQCVVFFDEVDSVCRKRSSREEEHCRRLKTELLRHMESWKPADDCVVFLGATNCPWDVDPAFLRRFQRLIYLPLPDREARRGILRRALGEEEGARLESADWERLLTLTEGYSGSDLVNFVNAALLLPIRETQNANNWRQQGEFFVPTEEKGPDIICCKMDQLPPEMVQVRQLQLSDFFTAATSTPRTVSDSQKREFEKFRLKFGHD